MVGSAADFDFLDIGCSNGTSLKWGEQFLGGKGLGIDLNPKKVAVAQQAGVCAQVGDATKLDFPDNSVRFVMLFDVLEHLDGAHTALAVLKEAYRVAREFVLVRGPNFDHIAELADAGLKKYYADWRGHTWHHTTRDLYVLATAVTEHPAVLLNHEYMVESHHHDLLPLDAPPDQGRYDPDKYGPKPTIRLKNKTAARMVMVLPKLAEVNAHEIALIATGYQIKAISPASAALP